MEHWKYIPGWDNMYMCSSLGRVKGMPKQYNNYTEKLLTQIVNHRNQYLMVTLSHKGNKRTICVHRLVAELFIPNPLDLREVNHKKTKNDNTIDDLEWMSSSDNNKDAYKRGLKRIIKGANRCNARSVGRFLDGRLIEKYPYISAAIVQGYCRCGIGQALKKGWLHKGYTWKYLDNGTTKRYRTKTYKIGSFFGTKLIKEYPSISSAVEEGYERRAIYRVLKKEAKQHYGYDWRYLTT